MTIAPELMERLRARAAEHARICNHVARMLYQAGAQNADTDGEMAPTWDDILAEVKLKGTENPADHDAARGMWLDHLRIASNILDMDATSCLAVARILLDQAEKLRCETELDLWRKIERAAGYEPGSLTGKPGVAQRVFI